MGKIIPDLAVTLDGFIEGPSGETDWCILDKDMDFGSFLSGIDTIFYGRVSYDMDMWGNFQPDVKAEKTEKALCPGVPKKYVFSGTPGQDARATYITSDIAEKVTEIRKQPGKDIWLYGGAKLIRTFISLRLVDVYRM